MSACLAFYDHLSFGGPQQSPLARKVLHLDHIWWTQVVTSLAHSYAWILPDSLFGISQEIRPAQLTFDEHRTRSRSPADYIRVLLGGSGKLVQHHGALSAKPANSHRN